MVTRVTKSLRKKEARAWINEHIVNKQNASYKEALICFDIKWWEKWGDCKSQLVIGFRYLGETQICELETHKNAEVTWAFWNHRCKKIYLKICFPVFLCYIVLANFMKCASVLLWDYMGARALNGDVHSKEQAMPCFKCVLFHDKVVLLIQAGW